MQLQLSDKEIKELATNTKVYAHGRELWEQDVVRDRHYDPDQDLYEAKVYSPSGSTYDIALGVTSEGRLRRATCTCKAYRSYWGFCKHIVATLLDARRITIHPEALNAQASSPSPKDATVPGARAPLTPERQQLLRPVERTASPVPSIVARTREERRARRETRDLIRQLEAAEARSEARRAPTTAGDGQARLEITLIMPGPRSRYAQLKLRIGIDRLYVVKNVSELLEAASSGQSLSFGKQFDYQPTRQRFVRDDQAFLDWLWAFYVHHPRQSGEGARSNPYFRQNTVLLPIDKLAELLKFAAQADVDWTLYEERPGYKEPFAMEIHTTPPPVSFVMDTTAVKSHVKLAALSSDAMAEDADPIPATEPVTLRRLGRLRGSRSGSAAPQSHHSTEYLDIISPDGDVLYFRDNVYVIPDTLSALTGPLLLAVESAEDQILELEPQDLGDLLNLIYHPFTQANILQTTEHFAEAYAIEDRDLTMDIWLDREGRDVTLCAHFIYGDLRIDPHPNAKPLDADLAQSFVIRNRRGENDFAHWIQAYGFRPAPPLRRRSRSSSSLGLDLLTEEAPREASPATIQTPERYYLHGDERILNFLANGVEELREHWNLYASQAFLRMKPATVPSLGTSLSLGGDSSFLKLAINDQGEALSSEDIQAILAAYREKKRFVRVTSGRFFDLGEEAHEDLDLLLRLDDWGAEWQDQGLRMNRFRSLAIGQWLQSAQDQGQLPAIDIDPGFMSLIQDMQSSDSMDWSMPAGVNAKLRPYQERGVRWLEMLTRYNLGGILADEMGLGKTLQALVYILSHKDDGDPALIVAPTSLVYNWEREARQFTPDLRVRVINGTPAQRREQLEDLRDVDLVITSYSLARQDLEALQVHRFSSCFLDEAQYIKNPRTQTSRAIKQIQAAHRFALSGTPLENSLVELWSLFDYLMPGYLFTLSRFQEDYAAPMLQDDPRAAEELRFLIAPFILRRLKKDVLTELPSKITLTYHCDMTEEQQRIYQAQLGRARSQLQVMDEWESRRSGEARLQILSLLTRLRQVACHPSLFLQDYDGGSGKMDMLDELMDQLMENGNRVLIFSQFTSMLALIRQQQEAKGRQIFYIDGQVSSLARLQQVERFNAGEGSIFLISLRAGGTGLNLATADTVIHVDPWWNPAVENQATDRAHRIGQTQVVQVIRLITGGSIEERIQDLQSRKQDLLDAVVKPGETFLNQLSLEELSVLFS